ncbi:hypothetical protein cyc_04833 [Cyclospora cayetanensis]|uniref:Uncharacterized protein n=1 Tax=Cyclospora cayetanensis TaxID=88456 RepID=A0A1D3CZ26_9EIME|nr:hypothetical protein cyc_04833 [Cyclospora cayetanensis]
MGAVCGKQKSVTEPKTRQAAVEVSDAPVGPNSNQPPPIAASAVCPNTARDKGKVDKVEEFVTGEGDGVYLMLVTENNTTSLVQQYAHSRPQVPEGDLLLLQIKPPVYVEIKESRFAVQNGKRTLKVGLSLAMGNPDGQKKVCEAVLECLRLTCAYSAYIHCYAAMEKAPFSVLLVVCERHEPACIKDGPDGSKYVTASAEGTQEEKVDAQGTAEVVVSEKVEDPANPKAEEAKHLADRAGDSTKDQETENSPTASKGEKGLTIFEDVNPVVTETTAPKLLKQVQVLRHMAEGRSPNFSLLRYMLVVPLSKPDAENVLKDGTVVDDGGMDALQKSVEKLHGVMVPTAV